MQRIAVAANDVLGLRHLFLERGIVRREPIATVRSLDQKQQFTVAGMQTVDSLFRQANTERVAEFADLQFDHSSAQKCYYYCNNIYGLSQGSSVHAPLRSEFVLSPRSPPPRV